MMFLQQMSHGVLSESGCSVLTALSPKKKWHKRNILLCHKCNTVVFYANFSEEIIIFWVVEVNSCTSQLQRQKSLK